MMDPHSWRTGTIQGFFPHLSPWGLLAVLSLCLFPTLALAAQHCFSSLGLASSSAGSGLSLWLLFEIYLWGYVQGAVSLQVLHISFFFRVQALLSVPGMPGTSAQPVLLCSAPWGRRHILRATAQDSLSPDLSCPGVKEWRGEDWRGKSSNPV